VANNASVAIVTRFITVYLLSEGGDGDKCNRGSSLGIFSRAFTAHTSQTRDDAATAGEDPVRDLL
jgi:hypothetical protein